MELKKMYKGQVFSPTAVITTNISATDTMIPVNNIDAFPDAPNIATIGVDIGAETIIYNNKTSTILSGCVRGVEGIAKDWEEGTVIGRNFTAKDHGDMVDNIEELAEGKLDAEFKVEVTNSDEISIEGKALDATQNNEDIVGSLAYDLKNHTHSEYTKTYKSLVEINPSFTINTPVKDVVLAMEDNSMAIYYTSASDTGVYPTVLGTVIITKYDDVRSYVQCSHPTAGIWYTGYHSVDNPNCEWKLVATQSSYNITPDMFKNGWRQYNGHQQTKVIKTGNIVNLVGFVNIGATDLDAIIFTVKQGYRPKVTQAIDRWNISFRLNTDGTLRVFSTSVTSGTIDLNGICWEV